MGFRKRSPRRRSSSPPVRTLPSSCVLIPDCSDTCSGMCMGMRSDVDRRRLVRERDRPSGRRGPLVVVADGAGTFHVGYGVVRTSWDSRLQVPFKWHLGMSAVLSCDGPSGWCSARRSDRRLNAREREPLHSIANLQAGPPRSLGDLVPVRCRRFLASAVRSLCAWSAECGACCSFAWWRLSGSLARDASSGSGTRDCCALSLSASLCAGRRRLYGRSTPAHEPRGA